MLSFVHLLRLVARVCCFLVDRVFVRLFHYLVSFTAWFGSFPRVCPPPLAHPSPPLLFCFLRGLKVAERFIMLLPSNGWLLVGWLGGCESDFVVVLVWKQHR